MKITFEDVRKDKEMQSYISSLIYNFSLPEWEMTEDKYKLADLFNLMISNNLELLLQKLRRKSVFSITPYGSISLPSYSLILISLIPLFYYFNNSYTEATVSFHSAAVSVSEAMAPRPASHWRFTEAGDVPLYVLRWFTHVSMSKKW